MTATEIFKHAHKVARMMKAKWPEDTYRACFIIALRDTYRQIAEHNAAKAAKAAAKAAEEQAKAAEEQAKADAIKGDAVAQALVKAGANLWIKGDAKRIYLNLWNRYECRINYYRITRFFAYTTSGNRTTRIDQLSRSKESELVMGRYYYDVAAHEWHGAEQWIIDALRPEFRAAA